MAMRPAYSPDAPLFGCMDIASNPVTSHRMSARFPIISLYPAAWSSGAKGCMLANSPMVIGIISEVALSFMVQEPKGIIEWHKERSLASSLARYLSISCSEWYVLNTGWVKKSLVLLKPPALQVTPCARDSAVNEADPPERTEKSTSTSSREEVSSKAMDTWLSSSCRMLYPLATAASTTPAALPPPTLTETVSKKRSDLTLMPSSLAPAARMPASPWTLPAICFRPSGPW
mmetsp:Transcript_12351/g.34366  ORF Transcript_12351/g.34366 Transcript_12351/m.34366 type:complete len:231 (+) Transcript_12351:1225-1917(+)